MLIFNAHTTVHSDHINLLSDNNSNSSRFQRWKILLNEYNVEIQYIKGEKNNVADFLSGCYKIGKEEPGDWSKRIMDLQEKFLDKKEIENEQLISKESTEIPAKRFWVTTDNKIFISSKAKKAFLALTHEYLVHPGAKRWYLYLKQWFYLKNLNKEIQKFRKTCIVYQRYSQALPKYREVGGTLQTDIPLNNIASDILGPFNSEEFTGNYPKIKFYLLTIIDRCTRVLQLRPIFKITPKHIITALQEWVSSKGKPKDVLTDNGRQYISKITSEYLQSNGIAEWINTSIARTMATLKHLSIKQAVKKTEDALNNIYHTTLGCAPMQLLNGYCNLDPLRITRSDLLPHVIARAKSRSWQSQQVENKNRFPVKALIPGSKVMILSRKTGKLSPQWDGPFTLVHRINNSTRYLLKNVNKNILTNLRQLRTS